VLGPATLVLRFFGPDGDDRLLIVNLGPDLVLSPPSDPLLAPPSHALWDVYWSSEDPRYGGDGIAKLRPEETWNLTGHSALVLCPLAKDRRSHESAPPRAGALPR
jgi:maltooligosyltrehalose trehalohydrolase